jgi:hypothetical protein
MQSLALVQPFSPGVSQSVPMLWPQPRFASNAAKAPPHLPTGALALFCQGEHHWEWPTLRLQRSGFGVSRIASLADVKPWDRLPH